MNKELRLVFRVVAVFAFWFVVTAMFDHYKVPKTFNTVIIWFGSLVAPMLFVFGMK